MRKNQLKKTLLAVIGAMVTTTSLAGEPELEARIKQLEKR